MIKKRAGLSFISVLSYLVLFLLSSAEVVTGASAHFLHGRAEELSQPLREPTVSSPAWLILLPFPNAPGPGPDVDTRGMNPYGKPGSSQPPETHQAGIRFDRCIDTDMCLFILPGEDGKRDREIIVELFGIDVPLLRENCEHEIVLANGAIELLRQVLSETSQIEVYDHYKVGPKYLARVVADGQDLSQLLISQGFAAPKGNGKTNWCTE